MMPEVRPLSANVPALLSCLCLGVCGGAALAGCSLVSLSNLTGGDSGAADADVEGAAGDSAGTPDATSLDGARGATDGAPEDADAPPGDATRATDAGADAGPQSNDSGAAGDSGAPPADSGAMPEASGFDAGSVYAATILADGPQAYYRFDETSGTVAHDSSGNGNDATYTGGFSLSAPGALIGDPDTAVTLNGTSAYVDVGNRFNFAANVPFSLEIWALPSVIDVNYRRVFSREDPMTPRNGYLVFLRSPNSADPSTYSMERWSNGATNQCPETTLVTAVWHHLVATYDGTATRIYIDATLAESQPAPLSLAITGDSLWIGASVFDTAAYFEGTLDEAAIYDTALSQSQITTHFHASGR